MAITDVFFQNNLEDRIGIDGSLITDFSNLKVLVADVASNNHATFREQGTTSGYQVPASSRFRIAGSYITNHTAGVLSIGIQSCESDVNFDSASAPTNPDVASGVTMLTIAANTDSFRDYPIIIPTSHYVYLYASGTAAVYVFGYEETVS